MAPTEPYTTGSLVLFTLPTVVFPPIGGYFLIGKRNPSNGLRYFAVAWCVLIAICVLFTDYPIFTRLLSCIVCLLPALYFVDLVLEQKKIREEEERQELEKTVTRILEEPTMEEQYLAELEKKYTDE